MRGLPVSFAALALAGAAQAEPVTRIAAAPARDGWFVCDAVSGPIAAFAGKVADGRSVITLLDRRTGAVDTQRYDVGPGDPGAGNVYWPLSRNGRDVGNVRGINPGMVAGSDGIPPIKQLTIGGRTLDCRWLGDMRFIGLDARRGAVVTAEHGGLVYRSFDFAGRGQVRELTEGQTSNVPTLAIAGGRETPDGYRFENKGFVYLVERPRGGGAGSIVVSRNGAIIGTDRLVGSTWAAPPRVAALDASAVWDGNGLDGCRRIGDPAGLRACVADRMKAAGVSAAGIAFARRADDGLGYIAGWRQAGPVGIATIAYPFRANTNQGSALIPPVGEPLFVDTYRLSAADMARPDYRAAMKAHPGAWPVAPGEVSVPRIAPGRPITIRVRTRLSTCHACEATGDITVAYRFDANGRPLGAAVERVD